MKGFATIFFLFFLSGIGLIFMETLLFGCLTREYLKKQQIVDVVLKCMGKAWVVGLTRTTFYNNKIIHYNMLYFQSKGRVKITILQIIHLLTNFQNNTLDQLETELVECVEIVKQNQYYQSIIQQETIGFKFERELLNGIMGPLKINKASLEDKQIHITTMFGSKKIQGKVVLQGNNLLDNNWNAIWIQ